MQKAVVGMVRVLGGAAEAVLVKEHAVHHHASFPSRNGWGQELATALGHLVHEHVARGHVAGWGNRAVEEEPARLELKLEGTYEVEERLHAIRPPQLLQQCDRMLAQNRVHILGRFTQERLTLLGIAQELIPHGLADDGGIVVQEAKERLHLSGRKSFLSHGYTVAPPCPTSKPSSLGNRCNPLSKKG